MTIEIFDCPQGSDEWFRARLGLPTASEFHTVLASGKGGGESVTRKKYLYQLAGEILSGEPMESYSNDYMARGKAMEEEARRFYSFMTDAPCQQVGFVKNGQKGCSPDSLIGDDGALEIKTVAPHILIGLMEKDQFPPAHAAQCQGNLLVLERDWIDLECYWPKFKPFIKRAYRDVAYIARLEREIAAFNDELAALVERVRRFGMSP
jgi:hypothetical protein